jgi:hypothetical protein
MMIAMAGDSTYNADDQDETDSKNATGEDKEGTLEELENARDDSEEEVGMMRSITAATMNGIR